MPKRIAHALTGLKARDWVCLAAFSLLLAGSVVLDGHIRITGDTYEGSASQNYISPYSVADVAALAISFVAAFAIALAAYLALRAVLDRPRKVQQTKALETRPIAVCGAVLFCMHLPYLLAYWPGFIFVDSLDSLGQALGYMAYWNHHPVAYTLLIKICIGSAHALGLSTTTGCAIYSIAQTAIMCATYATMIQWVMQRTRAPRWCRLLLVAAFGLTPYVATYSIALWKDPLFSAAIVIAALLLFDLVKTDGAITSDSKAWLPAFAISCLAIAFLRSNGLLIDCGIFATIAMWAVVRKRAQAPARKLAIAAAVPLCAVVANLVITGPVYAHLGVLPNEKVEGYGIPLNQMARVIVYGGNMSDEDKAYMSEMMPLDEYADAYSPTCIDSLKWDPRFNAAPLEGDFAKHWVSMLIKNPRIYFESWELQTFGFWTVGDPNVLQRDGNIVGGNPQNDKDSERMEQYDIHPTNLLGDWAREAFPMRCPSIPLGWIAWGVAFLPMALCLQGKKRYAVALVPSLLLAASLLVASPIWYWERYGAALQFLVPFLIALPFAIPNDHANDSTQLTASELNESAATH